MDRREQGITTSNPFLSCYRSRLMSRSPQFVAVDTVVEHNHWRFGVQHAVVKISFSVDSSV